MSLADDCIYELDAALNEVGETVRLQRMTTGPDGLQIPYELSCYAAVRTYQPQSIIAVAGEAPDTSVILSPTPFKISWPEGPKKDDRIIIANRVANIQTVEVLRINGQVVRYNLTVRE